jgi:hypothetical protein
MFDLDMKGARPGLEVVDILCESKKTQYIKLGGSLITWVGDAVAICAAWGVSNAVLNSTAPGSCLLLTMKW